MSCNCDIKDILHYDSKTKTLTIDQSVKLVVANKENGALQVAGGGEFNTSNSPSTALKVDTIEGLTSINPKPTSGCLDTINNYQCGLRMDGMAGHNGFITTGNWGAQQILGWGDGSIMSPGVSILGGPSETVKSEDAVYYNVVPNDYTTAPIEN